MGTEDFRLPSLVTGSILFYRCCISRVLKVSPGDGVHSLRGAMPPVSSLNTTEDTFESDSDEILAAGTVGDAWLVSHRAEQLVRLEEHIQSNLLGEHDGFVIFPEGTDGRFMKKLSHAEKISSIVSRWKTSLTW